ncbi:MAG: hypothetical protein WB820_22230, partial [Rhodoplanes sp.]
LNPSKVWRAGYISPNTPYFRTNTSAFVNHNPLWLGGRPTADDRAGNPHTDTGFDVLVRHNRR